MKRLHCPRFHGQVALVALLVAGVSAPRAVQDHVELRWRGKVGDVLRYRMTQEQTVEMSMMPEAIKTETAFVLRQEIKMLSPEGIGSVDVEYEAIRMDVGGPRATSYDSTRTGEASKENDPHLSAMFAPLLAAKVHLEIAPSGHVLDIEGLDEAMQEAFDEMENEAMAASFKQMFDEESLRRMVEVNIFPEEPLAVGDTWERSMEIEAPSLGTMKIDFENELLGIEEHGEQDCAKIGVTGELELDREGIETPIPMDVSVDDSDIAGTTYFALERGYLIESSMEIGMDLSMSSESPQFEVQVNMTSEQRLLRIGEDDPFFE